MGVLHADAVRGKEVISFEYGRAWLENPHARVVDPELQLLGERAATASLTDVRRPLSGRSRGSSIRSRTRFAHPARTDGRR